MDRIGFIGLGSMGEPMATRLASAGLEPLVFDLRDEPAQRIEKLGGRIARSVEEVGRDCDVIQMIVLDDAQVREVVLGKAGQGGLLDSCSAGDLIVVHSTVKPDTVTELAERAAQKGVGLIDAPVSGAAPGAADGTLSLMVGGDSTHLERCHPVFAHLSAHIFHVGDVGMGLVAKLANNLVAVLNGRSLSEGLELAQRAGVEPEKMLEILNASTGRSWGSEKFGAMRQATSAPSSGSASIGDILKKDIGLAVGLGKQLGSSLPMAEQLAAGTAGGTGSAQKDERERLTEPRIRPLAPAEWSDEQRELLARSKGVGKTEGEVVNILATLARHPNLSRSWGSFGGHILGGSTLPERERELLILRIGWLCGSEYEFGQHTLIGKAAGLEDAEIDRITEGADAPGWSESDVLLLRAVDDLHADSMISETTWRPLAKRFDEQQMMDIVFTVGQYNLVSMALNSFGVQLDAGVPGFPS